MSRCALYWCPAPGTALHDLGGRWLGRDAASGERPAQPRVEGVAPERFAAITASARRYGFHATLKAPFCLAEGVDAAVLERAAALFAARWKAFEARLEVADLDGFVALTLARPTPAMRWLADDVVRAFEPLRAPPTADELARRRGAGLTPRQDARLAAYGYPYVFEDFTFHMTLSARLDGAEAWAVAAAAKAWFAPALAGPVSIDALAAFEEPDGGGDFTLKYRHRFLAAGKGR